MFCPKCGKQIADDQKFCPGCGYAVNNTNNSNPPSEFDYDKTVAINRAPDTTQSFYVPVNEAPVVGNGDSFARNNTTEKKKGPMIALIAGISVVVIAAIVVVICLIAGSGGTGKGTTGDGKTKNSDGGSSTTVTYKTPVENYLDFIAEKNDDVHDYVRYTYMGGEFGEFHGGKDSLIINEIILSAAFDNYVGSTMYYGYDDVEDTWEESVKASSIDYFYSGLEDAFGECTFDYQITESDEIPVEDVYKQWEELLSKYNDLADYYDFDTSEDERTVYNFVDKLNNTTLSEAYSVTVNVEITGDKASKTEEFEFSVAKAGEDWIILEGPNFYELKTN